MSEKSSGSGSGESYTERVARIFGDLESQSPTSSVSWQSGDRLPVPDMSEEFRGTRYRSTGNERVRRRRGLRYTPDYMKHPEKWVKYDLTEDGTENMERLSGDQINKTAALQFLQSRGLSVGHGTQDALKKKAAERVVFKRPSRSIRKLTEKPEAGASDYSRISNSAVHMMKEYEVGAKRDQKKKRPGHVSSATAVDDKQASQPVHLSHLENDDM